MRLLKRDRNGKITLTQFAYGNVPPYAILSHTWGKDEDEVKLQDIPGTAENKLGYTKIAFCADRAASDGFEYFWVDTCCIDKTSSAELQESINSMFRWYRDAAVCYVYLADVSTPAPDDSSSPPSWELTFRKSRWFTRGWTLQELIAPKSVEFFSKEGICLGTKMTLERHISEITGVPAIALRANRDLSSFTVDERMAWMRTRETTREEDIAYSLLGIFNVHMSLIYSEGREKALKRLKEEIDKDTKGTQRADFSVPFGLPTTAGVEMFVAREDELVKIHKTLQGDGSRRVVVLHGLGGIGKTQLAIAYAKRHRRDYSAVFWLNAKDKASLQQSFARVATQIQGAHPSASRLGSIDTEQDLDRVVDAVRAWLSLADNTRWLVVYDNYDNPKLRDNKDLEALDVRDFLPDSDQGSVIITTRVSRVENGPRIHVKKLGMDESLKILSTTSRRDGVANDPEAVKLARELDGLPLALATAGAYLDQVGTCSFQDYLRLYRDSWAKLQMTSPELSTYDHTLYSTWQLSFQHVKRQNARSANLLRWWAYFDNQDVWLELLQHCDDNGPEWIRQLTEDELEFNHAVRVLANYGLIEADMTLQQHGESRGYSMHVCVHTWTIHVLNREWDYDLAKTAIRCVAAHVPGTDTVNWWLTHRRLIRHAERCFSTLPNDVAVCNGMEWAFLSLGRFYKSHDKLGKAEKMYMRALQGREKTLGPDHTSTLTTVHNLGNLYQSQDKLGEAEQMYIRALQGYEKALGPDHMSTLNTVHNLGSLYQSQDKLGKAEQMYMRALQGREKTLGPDHTSTLNTVHNLGSLYQSQGKLREAKQMYIRALQGEEKALGPDHTSTLTTVHNLGNLYQSQDKLGEAEQMYIRALQGYEKSLGPDHTSTLTTVHNLGNLYQSQDKLGEAEQMYIRALQGYEKALGPDHTSTLNTVHNLGSLYQSQGKLNEAEQIYMRALQGYEKALGPDHTSTLDTVHNLGSLYKSQGKLGEAEQMYMRALQGREKTLSPDHTSTLTTVHNLGNLYQSQGKLNEAEQIYMRALQGYEKALGPDHTSTLDTVHNLGNLYKSQGKLNEAEQMYIRALQGYEKALGPDHTSTLNTVHNLGSLLSILGQTRRG